MTNSLFYWTTEPIDEQHVNIYCSLNCYKVNHITLVYKKNMTMLENDRLAFPDCQAARQHVLLYTMP